MDLNRDMRSATQDFLNEYRKSIIQSEAEVRSKFIVPLLSLLGYPSEFRAEEFPVYGYEGGKKLPSKNADFILFDANDFGNHRTRTQDNLAWVYDHSILVVEAKKPGEMPNDNDLGQAQFYTAWTRAIAYIETDGEVFIGRFFNSAHNDYEVINLKVDELGTHVGLWSLSYSSALTVKRSKPGAELLLPCINSEYENGPTASQEETIAAINSLPENTIGYIQQSLGKNAVGLDRVQMVSRFLNLTDAILMNDLRYDIPAYSLDLPRHEYEARLYINDMLFPTISGTVIDFYWNDIERFFFKSRYLQALIVLRDNHLTAFEIGFGVVDSQVSERISGFLQVEKCLTADTIRVSVESKEGLLLMLPTGNPGNMWTTKKEVITMHSFWLEGLYKLKAIEEYYEIEFRLKDFVIGQELGQLYDSIDIVYAGTCMLKNCEIKLAGNICDSDVIVEEPTPFQDADHISLPKRTIHNITFKPFKSTWLPSRLSFSGKTEKDQVIVPVCCEYCVDKDLSC